MLSPVVVEVRLVAPLLRLVQDVPILAKVHQRQAVPAAVRDPVEIRDDEVFVGVEAAPPHEETVTDVMAPGNRVISWGAPGSSLMSTPGIHVVGIADLAPERGET